MTLSPMALADDLGQTIVMQGNGKGAMACSICHGASGAGQAQAAFPKLAGLDPEYMQKQLEDFTTAKRNNPVMSPIAKALTKEEAVAVSSYFAQMPTPAPASANVDEPLIQAGKRLAEEGNWANDIPSCFACHGTNANGIGANFPALAGQHASYIEQQLNAWRSGQRSNDPNQLMASVSQRLSEAEIKAVSAFLANLSVTEH
ncbi:c-type cytochrome [Amphritea opalescens]|nr:c-type cytochrome [Amphritea opalescens]